MGGHWPRPAVLDRIPTEGDAVIEASAGTGKTYTLEHLVIDLVLRTGLKLEQILVVTFTEKAAAELAARLRTKMTEIQAGPWPEDEGWRIDDEAQQRLTRALTSFDSASISTIHAFCKRMLSEHAFVNGRLFHEELVDGRTIFREAFLSVVRRQLSTDPELKPYLVAWLQRDSLDALTDRLYEAHIRGGRIAPQYDAAAFVQALKTLSRMELTPAVLKPTFARAGFKAPSIQAALNRIKAVRGVVEEFIAHDDPAQALAALDREEHRRRREGGLFAYLLELIGPVVDDIPRLAELHRAALALEKARLPFAAAVVQVALPLVRAALTHEKRTTGRFDFDDMLGLVEEALRGPARQALLSTLRRRFQVALIDEFQDTDQVQWSIFRQVFADSPQHRLVVIGDPKQAIYGFRGADVQTYLQARSVLTRSATPIVHLTETYRATSALAGALNQLLDQTQPVPFFTGEIQYDHPVRAAGVPPSLTVGDAMTSAVQVFALAPKRDTLTPSAAARTLTARIAEEIDKLLSTATVMTASGPRPLSASDVFILSRTTQEGLEAAAALRAAGVPHAIYKQDGLFQTREAADVRDLLAAINEPHDRGRQLRAWLGPFFAVPLEKARHCLSLPASHPLLASLFRFRTLADDKRWARFFPAILAESGIIQRELLLSDSERELTNYLHIFEILLDEALQSKGTLTDLLQTMSAFIERRRSPEGEEGNVQRLESERAAVQIMTMHKSKGLEAPVVFLTGGLDRHPGFAHVYHHGAERCLHLGDNPPAEVVIERDEEDQRLAYVALTRAKSRLYLPYYGGVGRPVLQRLSGTYSPIDRALERVLADPEASIDFEVEDVPERPYRREAPVAPVSLPKVDSLLRVLLTDPTPPSETAVLRATHRGASITSYSRLKEAQGGYHPTTAAAEEEFEGEDRLSKPETPPDHLPGGTASGKFIHEMLELADLEAIRRQAGWAFWAASPEVQDLFQRGLRRYDRRPEHLSHSYQLVFDALTTPMALGTTELAEGVAGADRVVREMEFLYSVPRPNPSTANRTYVKGFIDVVIEHDDLVFVLDWKTDLLPSYESKTLTSHVHANYGLQADLYTLAIVRLLGIDNADDYDQRFGGTAYAFVRGMTGRGAGLYFTKPTWEQVVETHGRVTLANGRGTS